jgi:hypothetical protein
VTRLSTDAERRILHVRLNTCPNCRVHVWHGLRCGQQVRVDGVWQPCPCPSSAEVTA